MTEAQTVLTNFDVPADLRDDATVALLWAWLGLRGNRQVDQLAGIILAEPSTKRGAIVVAAMVALGVARWDSGRITEALDLAAQAVRQATERPYETTYFSPHLLLASALIYVRRLDDADALAQSALRSVQASAPGAGDSLAVQCATPTARRRASSTGLPGTLSRRSNRAPERGSSGAPTDSRDDERDRDGITRPSPHPGWPLRSCGSPGRGLIERRMPAGPRSSQL